MSPSHNITIRLPRRPHLIMGYAGMLPMLLILDALGVGIWLEFGPKLAAAKPHEWLTVLIVLAFIVPLTAIPVLLTVFMISDLFQDVFPRALTLDVRRRELTLVNIPCMSRTFEFDEIKSLEILKCRSRNGWWLYLCLAFHNRHWVLRIAETKSWGRLDGEVAETIERKFLPLATELNELLHVPIDDRPPCGPWKTFLIRGF